MKARRGKGENMAGKSHRAGEDHGAAQRPAGGLGDGLIHPDGRWDFYGPPCLDGEGGSRAYQAGLYSLDELLERDKQREQDGFPRKIRIGRLIKPGRGGKDKVVVVPTTVEEKFLHDRILAPSDEDQNGGSGEGEEGEVVGEEPIHGENGQGGAGGQGGEPHEMESSAYELGRILTEQFMLPNLEDKGKKRSLTNYHYDLTDRNRRAGQLLDKKATLRRILQTNIALGNLPDPSAIDPGGFVISPDDMVYRVLSKEVDYESQALVFFVRDYSGSMSGRPTELVVSQHVLIYSWLMYQYAQQVETRFILHDTEAVEVKDFYTYYSYKVAGGTKIASAYRLVNEITARENLARDYNIYVFHGTDGDDMDKQGEHSIPELRKMAEYANRIGITVAQSSFGYGGKSDFEKVLDNSKLLIEEKKRVRLDTIDQDANEARLIEGIKKLISEN